jgi:hypothetical protein
MAFDPRQATFLSPAAIAIHNDGHMLRNPRAVQTERGKFSIGVLFFLRQAFSPLAHAQNNRLPSG